MKRFKDICAKGSRKDPVKYYIPMYGEQLYWQDRDCGFTYR
jgi:hypothetical protein